MKKLILLLAVLPFILTSCKEKYQSHSFFAMDTFISVDAINADAEILYGLEDLVYDDEKKFSRTFSGSGIYEFNHGANGSVLSDDTTELLIVADELYRNTYGAFSPYMGALADLWDIKNVDPKVPDKAEIDEALKNCDASAVYFENGIPYKTNTELLIDLGGIAKGKSAENCIRYLKENGVENAVISFGGSVACIGHSIKSDNDWSIGIKNPFAVHEVIGSINVTNCYVAVSGAYERNFVKNGIRYHHIFDSGTGYPAESDIESTVIVSHDGAIADGLSTALFVMGSEKALEFWREDIYDFQAIFILKNGDIIVTDGLEDVFTFNNDASYKDGKKLKYEK
ncbi:MAG: FAD:protein FMN transferase [Ruminococcaceae bacterium]|nr:FAD:protein FMN transferase [Oscillospiraceae bacterium]